MQYSPFGIDQDLFFMNQALEQAQLALKYNEVPIGAVVVDAEGNIIGRGHNKVMTECTQSAHAEICAIGQAGKKQGDWRLEGCWIYITLEPCAMCMNLILLSRCAGLIYGASSPLFGYSQQEPLDNGGNVGLYKRDTLIIVSGVQMQESVALLQQFFRQKRNESGSTTK